MDIYFRIRIPTAITDDRDLAASALGDALGLDPDKLADRQGAEPVGRERWDAMTVAEKSNTLGRFADNANIFPTVFSIEISEYYGCGTN